MNERNKISYEIIQENKIYYLATSLIDNKIRFVCQDSKSDLFKGELNINELRKINEHFKYNNLLEIQNNFINLIKDQRINIAPLSIIFLPLNDEQMVIPLRNTKPNDNYSISFNQNNNNASGNIQLANQKIKANEPLIQEVQIIHQKILKPIYQNEIRHIKQPIQSNNGNNNDSNNNYQNQIILLNKDKNELKEMNQFLEKEKDQLISQVEQLKKSNNILTSSKEKDDKIIKDLRKRIIRKKYENL